MRSLADQSVPELGGRWSVLTRQKADHVELDRLLVDLAGTEPESQAPVLRRIYRLVFPHAFAEESVLWPVFRRVLPDGPALTLRIEREHQEVNELAIALEGLAAEDPDRPRILGRLRETLGQDVRDEEDRLLPQVQERLGVARLRQLGLAWEAVRAVAPTRPHPVVARRPPGNVLAALPLTMLDRLRDRVDNARDRTPVRGARLLAATSRRLASWARQTERLPVFRYGEHRDTSRA